ncbi:hypothetical protein [Reyranella sp.]|uniref:hypothetical protein n=1 Tax=Reyranella sp. TaxID=1929291 RepID=UPI0027317DE7|nr:hypothetical protein [Reyranella sp.]MDP2378741.1 hypothetical protein [Reyranella sp.]
MPVRAIGTIGVTPSSGEATVHVVKGGLSPAYPRAFAPVLDPAGFDLALAGYTASSAEGFLAAQHTERLGFLIAHRPGFVAPTLATRKQDCDLRSPHGRRIAVPPIIAGFHGDDAALSYLEMLRPDEILLRLTFDSIKSTRAELRKTLYQAHHFVRAYSNREPATTYPEQGWCHSPQRAEKGVTSIDCQRVCIPTVV